MATLTFSRFSNFDLCREPWDRNPKLPQGADVFLVDVSDICFSFSARRRGTAIRAAKTWRLRGRREKYAPKVFSALKARVPQQAKKRFGEYQKACFQGKRKKRTYTPKSVLGVCGNLFAEALVYRFWPPKRLDTITEFGLNILQEGEGAPEQGP